MSIHDAARNGDVESLTRIIGGVRLPAKVNARDKHSRTPLHLAAWANHPEVIKLLCSHGADVNATAMDDMSALHFAAQKCHAEACKALISCGAKVSAKTRKGLTVLHLVAMASAPKEKDKRGADTEQGERKEEGGTPGLTKASTQPSDENKSKGRTNDASAVGAESAGAEMTEHEGICCDLVRVLVRKSHQLLQAKTKKGDTAEGLAKSSSVKALLQQLASEPEPEPEPEREKVRTKGEEACVGTDEQKASAGANLSAAEEGGANGSTGGREGVEGEKGALEGRVGEEPSSSKDPAQKVALTFDEAGVDEDESGAESEGEGQELPGQFRKRAPSGARNNRPSRRSRVT